jgi:hypothetical protein
MINRSKIPEKEPKMSIGLVLPEDRQLDLEIKINGADFELHLNQRKMSMVQHELSIQYTPNGILVNDIHCRVLDIKNKSRTISNNIYLKPIIAGRGFTGRNQSQFRFLVTYI